MRARRRPRAGRARVGPLVLLLASVGLASLGLIYAVPTTAARDLVDYGAPSIRLSSGLRARAWAPRPSRKAVTVLMARPIGGAPSSTIEGSVVVSCLKRTSGPGSSTVDREYDRSWGHAARVKDSPPHPRRFRPAVGPCTPVAWPSWWLRSERLRGAGR